MIKLISGATRIGDRIYRPTDGAFTAERETEERLVALGAAFFVGENRTEAENASNRNESKPKQAPEAAPVEESDGEDIEAMSYTELKEYAQSLGIDTGRLRSRSAILNAIEETERPALAMDGVVI